MLRRHHFLLRSFPPLGYRNYKSVAAVTVALAVISHILLFSVLHTENMNHYHCYDSYLIILSPGGTESRLTTVDLLTKCDVCNHRLFVGNSDRFVIR